MVLYGDEVLKWKKYEKTKDKNFIDFSKNPEMLKKFIHLLAKTKAKIQIVESDKKGFVEGWRIEEVS